MDLLYGLHLEMTKHTIDKEKSVKMVYANFLCRTQLNTQYIPVECVIIITKYNGRVIIVNPELN
jgi:hypothetical protein